MKHITILIPAFLLLVSFAANDTQAQRQKPLNQAVADGDIERVKSEIAAGVDINSKYIMGWTLLHIAINKKHADIAQLLIDKGADLNIRDNRGRTPLILAVEKGQKEVIGQLIAKGAKVNEMDAQGNNALSLATKSNQTEIVELLKKNGAQEPDPQALLNDRLYSSPGRPPIANPSANYARSPQPVNTGGNVNQPSVTANLLADPNEIKARIKTFNGLEKALKEVSDKGQNEMRQWEQTRYDNRTILSRTVDRQFDDEIDLIRKAAVEESAKKTVAAIDNLLTIRHERSSKIHRELLEQRRQERLAASANTRTRGRGRTSGRNVRGRTSVRGQAPGANATNLYGRGAVAGPGGYGAGSANQPAEQLDPQTQEQMRLWLQATPDNKLELAKQIHPQMQAELSSIRTIAVEENAKKTTAAIDGVLLARQQRFDELVKKVEEQRRKLQEEQNLRNGTGVQNQANPYGRQTSGRGAQRGNLRNGTRGTRTRRR